MCQGEGLKIGDTIECSDRDDMIDYMYVLADEGIETDFMYEKEGQRGFWLVVTGFDDGNMDQGS